MRSLLQFLFLFWILLLPTQLAYHLFTPDSYVAGFRIDYYAIKIFANDLILLLLFSISLMQTDFRKYFLNTISFNSTKIKILLILYLLNLKFSINQQLTIQSLIPITFLISNFLISFYYLVRINTKYLTTIFTFQLLFLAIHSFYQFQTNHSINSLVYWLGERPISITMPGIAKQEIFNMYKVRPYSTFSHPNSLAGFTLACFWITFLFTQKNSRKLQNIIITISLFSTLTILTLTNSQGAWLATLFSLLSLILPYITLIVSIGLIIGIPVLYNNFNFNYPEYTFRQNQFNFLSKVTPSLILNGTGISSSIHLYPKILSVSSSLLQPIHNIFHFLLLETGFIPTLISSFIFLNKKLLKKEFAPLLVSILITGVFDHYWLTLHQNQHLLVFSFAFLLTYSQQIPCNSTLQSTTISK